MTGFYSYDHGRTGLESTYNSQLAGTDDSLFVRRLIDLVINRAPQGATVQTTIEPGCSGPRPRPSVAARVPWWRSIRRPARCWPW